MAGRHLGPRLRLVRPGELAPIYDVPPHRTVEERHGDYIWIYDVSIPNRRILVAKAWRPLEARHALPMRERTGLSKQAR